MHRQCNCIWRDLTPLCILFLISDFSECLQEHLFTVGVAQIHRCRYLLMGATGYYYYIADMRCSIIKRMGSRLYICVCIHDHNMQDWEGENVCFVWHWMPYELSSPAWIDFTKTFCCFCWWIKITFQQFLALLKKHIRYSLTFCIDLLLNSGWVKCFWT